MARAAELPLVTVLMTQVLGFSTIVLPYQLPPLVVGMQLGGVSMREGARLTLPLAAITLLLVLPVNYFWWRALGYL
jgi:di/tricarboxylate transporter